MLVWAVGLKGRRQEHDSLWPPMPIPNAFNEYENAIPAIIGERALLTYQPLYMADSSEPRVPPSVIQAVKQSDEAFETIQKGIHMVYQQPVVSLGTYPEPFAKNHQLLGKLILAKGDWHAQNGQIREAFAEYSDLLRFGNQLVNQGDGTTPLIGINLCEHARGSLWRISPRLTFGQMADTAALMRQMSVSQRSFGALLAKEERMTLFKLADALKRPNGIFAIYQKLGIDPFHSPDDLTPDMLKPLTKYQVRDDCIAFFDGWIERSSRRFAERSKEPSYEQTAPRGDPLLAYMWHHKSLAPAAKDLFWYAFLRNQAANGLAAGALATRAYWKREGRFPAKFEDFGLSLLSSLPPDPFADARRFEPRSRKPK